MKKQLLLGSALLAAISVFPQSASRRATVVTPNSNDIIVNRGHNTPEIAPANASQPAVNPQPAVKSNSSARSTASTTISWNAISGSMNIFGVLETEQKPVTYNDELDAVCFIHRKSFTYSTNPVASPTMAASGAIVAMVSTNWGADWDSTLLRNNNVQWSRYPQGGLYNPPGNTSLANAYAIATGPLTSAATAPTWVGNYAVSKKLDAVHGPGWTNVASTVTGAQQFFQSSASPYPANGIEKTNGLRAGFVSPDDGKVWALGLIFNDYEATTFASQGYRGARILKGTFNSGTMVFDWSGDSIIPPVVVTTASASPADVKNSRMLRESKMAWNEAGDIGYIYFVGALQGATGRNKGFQPIVYRTIDHGTTWHPINGINFNDTAYYNKPVLNRMFGTSLDTTYKIPNFDVGGNASGIDAVVDANNNLHIVSCITSASKNHTDSLFSTYSFSLSSDNEKGYSFAHIPGKRPFIYDFICQPSSMTSTAAASTWSVHVIDSMSTEAPGIRAAEEGFNDNPWDVDGTTKATCDPRIQVSRTANGKYLIYTWSESDTIYTNGAKKWNHLPDVKARVMDVAHGYTVNPIEINVTNFDGGDVNPRVASNAHKFYSSPKCKFVAEYTVDPTQGVAGVEVVMPMTVSNSFPLVQQSPCTHFYTSAALSFTYSTVGITENNLASVKNSYIYPNPASNDATLVINLKNSEKVNVAVLNTIGQVVKTYKTDGKVGSNNIPVDLKGLSSGIYLVNVTSGNASSTKKLIVE